MHFRVVLHGTAWLIVEGSQPLSLAQGDLVLLSRTTGHILASDLALAPVPTEQFVDARPEAARWSIGLTDRARVSG